MVKKSVVPMVLLACLAALAACSMTPPAVSTLMTQAAEAAKARSYSAVRACYATEKISKFQLETQVHSWDAYFEKGSNWTYSGVEYVSLAAAAHHKSILPETLELTQGKTMSGFRFEPNLKVIGFILVSFKQPDGSQAGATEMVGMASDGTAKFAVIEPKRAH